MLKLFLPYPTSAFNFLPYKNQTAQWHSIHVHQSRSTIFLKYSKFVFQSLIFSIKTSIYFTGIFLISLGGNLIGIQTNYKMSQDKNESPKRARQKFSDNNAREFGCPCGKSYLSYPALYTHVRTKHDGKPPGEIVKPKNEKTRGRPRTVLIDTPIDDSECEFNACEEVAKLLQDVDIDCQDNFVPSDGNSTCQDMASKFLLQLADLDSARANTVKYYLIQFQQFVDKKYGLNYWSQNSPEDIIDVANQFQRSHAQNLQKFPIPNSVFIDLTYILFKWMYRNKWTSHKLAKRNSLASEA